MKFLLASIAAAGHVKPIAAVGAELHRRGHEVRYATDPSFMPYKLRKFVLAQSYELPPIPDTEDGFGHQLVGRLALFRSMFEQCYGQLEEFAREFKPQGVVYDMVTPLGRVLARRLGCPSAALLPSFATNTESCLDAGINLGHLPLSVARPLLNDLSAWAETLKVPVSDVLMSGDPADLCIVGLPRSLQPAAASFSAAYIFVGHLQQAARPQDGRAKGRGGGINVVMSFGSRPRHRQHDVVETLTSLRDSNVHLASLRCALGDISDEELEALSNRFPNYKLSRRFNLGSVLRESDIYIGHGGSNSLLESVQAMTPSVLWPKRMEQIVNSKMAARVGIGLHAQSAESVADVLRSVSAGLGPDFSVGLRRVAEEIRSSGGAVRAADEIERMVATRSCS